MMFRVSSMKWSEFNFKWELIWPSYVIVIYTNKSNCVFFVCDKSMKGHISSLQVSQHIKLNDNSIKFEFTSGLEEKQWQNLRWSNLLFCFPSTPKQNDKTLDFVFLDFQILTLDVVIVFGYRELYLLVYFSI